MRLLLDTCSFLWVLLGADTLTPRVRALVADPANDVFVSAVSAWEIAVKYRLGRLPLPEPPERFIPAQRETHRLAPLPLDEESALHVTRLPLLHRDPFDRLLVCQALVHGLAIVTPDPLISQYPARIIW